MNKKTEPSPTTPKAIVCIGACNIDIIARTKSAPLLGTSNPAIFEKRLGGVALNVARNLTAAGAKAMLVSAIGDDNDETMVREEIARAGINTNTIHLSKGVSTGQYLAIESHISEVVIAAAQTQALENLALSDLSAMLETLSDTVLWFADTNLSGHQLNLISILAKNYNIPLAIDTVSITKALRIKELDGPIDIIFCNLPEASSLIGQDIKDVSEAVKALHDLIPTTRKISVSDGAGSVGIYCDEDIQICPVAPINIEGRLTTGAGDALISGTLLAHIGNIDFKGAVKAGITSARKHILADTHKP